MTPQLSLFRSLFHQESIVSHLRTAISVSLFTASAALAADAPPAAAPAAPPRPAYQVLRFNEDWSVLKQAGNSDWLDPLKYIPLNDDGSWYLTLGGQVRERVEYWNNFNFGAKPSGINDHDTFLLSRYMFSTDVHMGENFRVFAELKSAQTLDRDLAIPGTPATHGPRTLDEDSIDLQNGFGDLILPFGDAKDKFTFRVGRQELLFGNQRLVGPLDWTNTRRTFDGFDGIFNVAGWRIDAFWTRPVIVNKYGFNNSDSDTAFYGVYATGKLPLDIGIDLYWLDLESQQNAFSGTPFQTFNGTTGRDMRHTVGGRLFGKFGDTGFDYEAEGAYQFGDHAGKDISAFDFTGNVGYTFAQIDGTPRVYGMFDYASGDRRTGGDVETFNQLFPTGHLWLGYMDIIGRQNIIDASTGVSFKPVSNVTVMLDGHFFWLASDNDALYNASAGVVRAAAPGASNFVGTEIDLTVKYQFDKHIALTGGYSHFFAGDFIKESPGTGDSMDWVYVSFQFTF
jgi:hypothetical protein